MDRRSWLWRRKSSENSPAETDSTSAGSISSHSERFWDEQANATIGSQSVEVTSKAIAVGEENNNIRSLTEKLSAALMNISAKEDLVKQHAKVAEEAVSGWEKAEKDVLALKQQLDAFMKKNTTLEDRVGHLDGALKECVRQLRQAREEQERKNYEAVANKCHELESSTSELESQLLDLKAQLESAKTDTAASLELRIIERDLSTKTAETASKQHLERIKKLAKLETECRRLKAIARKASPANDQKSYTASSICVESFTDSQSDSDERLLAVETDMQKMNGLEMNESGRSRSDAWASSLITELDQFRKKAVGRNIMVPSVEINLMDDFLEMERLAALPDTESGSGFIESGPISNQTCTVVNTLKAELETLTHRIAQLEEKLVLSEEEKSELQMAFTESQKQLKTLQNQLSEAETKFKDVQTQLALDDNSKKSVEEEVEVANMNREVVVSRLRDAEIEIKALISKVTSLEEVIRKEQTFSAELEEKLALTEEEKSESQMAFTESQKQLQTLQNQLSEAETRFQDVQTQLALADNPKKALEEEVKIANMNRQEAETEINILISKVTSLEDLLKKEQALSAENMIKCKELENELSKMKCEAKLQHESEFQLVARYNEELKVPQDQELAIAARKFAECQKTIVALGQQLKSLATLEDFLVDSDKPSQLEDGGLKYPGNNEAQLKLGSTGTVLPRRGSSGYSKVGGEYAKHSENSNVKESTLPTKTFRE
ncbi:CBS / octicosapeptide/Phox/Bemp1 (PB1) domains-containing protein isoform 1 [Hibiscus syriacus]|uniref:CBS / octicosapeptide/Phox/Bemp1 (PB1) domains-containing protein isoform 1 n=1 Tax=Hibiscus syriacus TaxID=106335 RepID=A0A6A3BSZ3_HIBSY|nr:CBS / octicosapeptide/Phox/Bemp1 (PB1) domains-containing protein isoform 1 [Hibiscus syriacus]